jgi:DNA ligase-1
MNSKPFRPLLSPNESPLSYPRYFKELQYPLLCSPKYDGIRATPRGGIALSRSGLPLRSYQFQDAFNLAEYLDGEFIVGNPTDFNVYNRTDSHVMSFDKPADDIRFYVFDCTMDDLQDDPFYKRLEFAETLIKAYDIPFIYPVEHVEVDNESDLLALEARYLEEGFEGMMMRNPVGRYKRGRCTFLEGIIYKLKRFEDTEGLILDFEPALANSNTKEIDVQGYAKRSKAMAGRAPIDMLGKFIVDYQGVPTKVMPGNFNHKEREEIWKNPEKYRNRYLKFRHFPYGKKDAPRVARAIGFRDKIDMGV